MPLRLVAHPMAAHLVATLRDSATPPERFRHATRTLTTLLAIEATRSIGTATKTVQTPIELAEVTVLDQRLALVPVLRAGLGMLEPIVELFPDVTVGYIGLERHETTAIARSYYCKLPNLTEAFALCLDPMLATGGSASQAVSLMKSNGAAQVVMVCVVAAPEGVAKMTSDHPDVDIVCVALDRGLDARKFIVPGLGDFGDRLYGTL